MDVCALSIGTAMVPASLVGVLFSKLRLGTGLFYIFFSERSLLAVFSKAGVVSIIGERSSTAVCGFGLGGCVFEMF